MMGKDDDAGVGDHVDIFELVGSDVWDNIRI